MAVDAKLGILALQRFGLGVRSGDPSQVTNDPRAALEAEVTSRRVPMPTGSDLRSTKTALGELGEFRTARQIARDKEEKPAPQAGAVPAPQGAQQRQQGGAQAMAGGDMAGGDMAGGGMAGGGMAAGSGTMAAPANRAPEMRNPAQDIFRSEVSSGSGRTIFACRLPKVPPSGRLLALMSGRRSAPISLAGLLTCCWRSKRIRRC
jgi:hypothetical protein